MESELRLVKASELIKNNILIINDGFRAKNSELSKSDGLPFARAGNINDGFNFQDADYVPPENQAKAGIKISVPGDVVFTSKGTVGRFAYVAENTTNFVYSPQLCFWRTLNENVLSSRYLYYWMNSTEFLNQVHALKGQTDMADYVSLRDQRQMQVTIPELPKQKQIAHILDSFDQKIHLNRQTNQTLEQMAQALFKSWFVDFDPVIDNALAAGTRVSDLPEALQARGKIRQAVAGVREGVREAGQPTGPAGTPQGIAPAAAQPLPAEIRRLFPSEFVESELGWIPKGWEVCTADDEFKIKGGSTPSTKNTEFWEGGNICWTSPKDLSGNNTKILLGTSRKITEAGLAKITSGLLPVNTVLMSSRAPVGYLALAKVPVAINQGYIALLCEQTLSSEYTIQWLDSIIDEIKGISGGTTFAEISKKTFKSIRLVVPTVAAVSAFTKIVKANYERITANINEINSLSETRDYLLPKLISGELQLPTDGDAVIAAEQQQQSEPALA